MNDAYLRLLPWVRAQFPQISSLRGGQRRIYLDNAAGTLMPRAVSEAMADAAIWANPQPERHWPESFDTLKRQREMRGLLADFLNADPSDPIYLAESTTAALYKLREALEPTFSAHDNVVVTDCDHFANISPWEWRAKWEVRRAGMRPDGHLNLEHFASLLDQDTRVAAVTVAGNGVGTIIRVDEAVKLVRERAPHATVVLDAVHAAPHLPVDVAALGADALALSTYKLFGPNCGILWLRKPLSEQLSPYHVAPHTDGETLLEWGTLNNVTVAGIIEALGYLQRLGERLEPAYVGQLQEYPRGRRRFKVALSAIQEYERSLSETVLVAWPSIPGARLYGISEPGRVAERVPTFGFEVEGVPDDQLEDRFWRMGEVQMAVGSHYSAAVLRGMGRGSLARASFAHYNTPDEVERFLATLRVIAG
ncbi:MAG: aminotransferase class V-fold PLP-dependent enzyme [Actinomycetota bacterium]